MKHISRHMEQLITELSKSYPAVLLTEPRQMGKTTMLRELAKRENIGCEYASLDDLTTRDLAKNDPALFMQLHKPTVLIDEVQYAPELFTAIDRSPLERGTGAILCMADHLGALDSDNLIWMV